MSIKIGDKNKIKNSNIGHQYNAPPPNKNKTFVERHPILISFLVSLVVGFILLFSFWKDIIDWIEKLF
ncbi:hypothetical protein CN498_20710 [Bacillus thuringiensis]|uniref:Uncharacterized protein n=1 Tax=Bacillus cereus (strain G9842) TaxID=405531 RepID=B7IKG4_BACC2|nr:MULTISPECIES: hypothetical protein [Bacillus cereus group]ACK98094.1 hypothetical protein BCG9842_B2408 [Bacillus cereus G9842]MDR4134443.1 hypothetical protein [Bacillus cereus]MDR4366345.1 hypothetical protein [Bacillus cereus]PEA57082.1 hypothetical protein CON74_30695 [Bacillus thuringiensis]PER85621.1 hypothetical protein CN498_20710 [Bacillus thuringiensis]